MKIAVPLFKERVSPHFGSSSKVLVVEVEDAIVCREEFHDVGGETPMAIARRLLDLGVEKIVCGGIPNFCKEWLVSRGVTVLDNQRGPAREVIAEAL